MAGQRGITRYLTPQQFNGVANGKIKRTACSNVESYELCGSVMKPEHFGIFDIRKPIKIEWSLMC